MLTRVRLMIIRMLMGTVIDFIRTMTEFGVGWYLVNFVQMKFERKIYKGKINYWSDWSKIKIIREDGSELWTNCFSVVIETLGPLRKNRGSQLKLELI